MTKEQLEQAQTMRGEGVTLTEISRRLSVPRQTVSERLKRDPKKKNPVVLPADDPYGVGHQSALDDLPIDDLDSEVRLFRRYIHKAIADNVPAPVMADLLYKLGQLIKIRQTVAVRGNHLLTKDAMLSLGSAIVNILIDELQAIPNYEGVVDAVIARMFPTIDKATNSDSAMQQLTRIDI